MNRFLADTLAFLNVLVAIAIIVAGALLGYGSLYFGGRSATGAVVGGLAGLVVAAFVCGTIAYLALIEGHLRIKAEYGGGSGGALPSPQMGQERRL